MRWLDGITDSMACPSPSAGDRRELPRVPLRGEGSCGGIRIAGFREQHREKARRWESILHVFKKAAQKRGGVTEGEDGSQGRRSCEELVFYSRCNMKLLESADKNFTHCFKKSQGSDTMKSK